MTLKQDVQRRVAAEAFRTRVHEAGHVLASVVLKLPLPSSVMSCSGFGLTHIGQADATWEADADERAVTALLAGGAAEEQLAGASANMAYAGAAMDRRL